jgi:hypothetical protein
VLARHPRLTNLAFTSRLLLSGDRSTEERRRWYAQLAEVIMENLARKGLQIHMLEVLSRFKTLETAPADEDRLTWPRYTYKKGTTTIIMGERTEVKVTAVPYSERAHG